MFGEKFKKASKNITVSETILHDTRQKMLDAAAPPVKRTNYFARTAVSFACIAVVICIGVWGIQISTPPQDSDSTQKAVNNLFSISAYAYEQQDGQLKQKEINLSQSSNVGLSENIVAISGGENNEYEARYIKLLGVVCKGDTIQKVDFQIDNGVLKIPNKNWETEKLLKNLESKGKQLTVDYSEGAPIEIYWESDPFRLKVDTEEGTKFTIGDSQEAGSTPILTPEFKASITATVHFKDGSQVEKSIVYDASKGSVILEETK